MHTPSLRRRVTRDGVVVFVVVLVLLNAFVHLTLRAQLEATLDEVLAARAELARELGEFLDPDELADRLGTRGVPAVITTPDGRRIDTEALSSYELRPPTSPGDADAARVSTTVGTADGTTVEVSVSRGGVDRTLRRVLGVTLLGSVLALVAAVILLRRSSSAALAPLEQVIDAARRTAEGHAGERLDPDEPDTELGRFATAYDDMLDALEHALAETVASRDRTRRFLDDAAHQLRTPLTTIRATAETLLRDVSPEVQDELMAIQVREVARTDRLLTALLTLARLDSGSPIAFAPADLVTICREEVERCASVAPDLAVTLEVVQAPGELTLDANAVQDLLGNLLDNARRHADSRIEVTVTADDAGRVEVTVWDDGPGVPDDQVDRIFERFTSLDGRGGSGLGLAIGRAIAERHGGSLDHDGARFVLRLPAAREPAVAQT